MKSNRDDDASSVDVGTALSFSVVAGMAVHRGPISGIVASPDGSRLVLTNYGDDSVALIHTGTWAGIEPVTGINEPFVIAMSDADPRHAYVSMVSAAYDAVAVIDLQTNSVVASHPVDLTVTDLVADRDGRRVYVSRSAATGADVAVLDTATGGVKAIDIAASAGSGTECVRLTPDGQQLYVATQRPAGGEVVVVDTRLQRVVDTIGIGCTIRDIAISSDGATAYVASSGADFGAVVDVIDTRSNKVTSTRKLHEISGWVTQLRLSGDGDRAYLVGEDGVSVLCTATHDVIGTVTVGSRPSCVAESPDGKYLYVADYSGAVTVVSIAAPTASLMVPADDERTAPFELGIQALPLLEPALT